MLGYFSINSTDGRQVMHLKSKGISAESIHSGLHKKDIDRILDNAIYGNLKFLYLAPERLNTELFLNRLEKMQISLVAIDESHCISQWGHDFRPSYLEIHQIREVLADVPFIALTATATKHVINDITEFLKLRDTAVFSKSFRRDNLRIIVRKEIDKRFKLLEICQKVSGSIIVYSDTRKHCKDYADLLINSGISASYYHAGLPNEQKKLVQSEWISGKNRVICATNAFGMGIDKSNVRVVIHPYLPLEPESYYQEIGRAGRDGKTSLGVLIYNDVDIENASKRVEAKYPSKEQIKKIYHLIFQYFQIAFGTGLDFHSEFDIRDFCLKYGVPSATAHYALKILAKAGYFSLNNFGREKSRVGFKKNHTDIYKFQVAQPAYDDFLTVLIRSYGGLFEHLVAIDEKQIALRAKTTLPVVHSTLEKLEELDLITYQKKTSNTVISILQNRIQENYLTIPKAVYDDSLNRDLKRLETMKQVALKTTCKMNIILEYFGEKPENPCGKCNSCTEIEKLGLGHKEFNELVTAIKIALSSGALHPNDLLKKLPKFKKDDIALVASWMVDNSLVKINNNQSFQLSRGKQKN